MPSSTKRQAKTMRAVAHNKGLSRKLKIPQKAARDFVRADKRKAGKKR